MAQGRERDKVTELRPAAVSGKAFGFYCNRRARLAIIIPRRGDCRPQSRHLISHPVSITPGRETIVTNPLTKWYIPRIAVLAAVLLGAGWFAVVARTPAPNAPPALSQIAAVPPMPGLQVPLNITIDPKAPLKDLLPAVPKARKQKPSAFVEDLADVPELMLTEPMAKGQTPRKTIEALALQIAKINQLNKEKRDRLVEWMANERPDLAGLPFQMGNECRQSRTRGRFFKKAVSMVHNSRNTERQIAVADVLIDAAAPVPAANSVPKIDTPVQAVPAPPKIDTPVQAVPAPSDPPQPAPRIARNLALSRVTPSDADGDSFLVNFLSSCIADDNTANPNRAKEHREHAASARLAAMTQICGPTSDSMKLAMARYIASVSSVESTRMLVKTILFTPEEDARNVAIEALKARRDKDYVDLLLQGFRYPWPDVSKRAADALVKLDRKDLVPQLIDMLDEPDPRAPVTKTVNGKTLTTVRELVRINHHRNCVMCHAPGQDVQDSPDILTAETPLPDRQLPSPNEGGYGSQGIPEILVRIDVTYLRQDFSMLLPVADAAPWPEMQRFDFVARTRVLKDDEVQAYMEKFDKLEPGVLPPNHRAALAALRELTGKDAAPTSKAWRILVSAAK